MSANPEGPREAAPRANAGGGGREALEGVFAVGESFIDSLLDLVGITRHGHGPWPAVGAIRVPPPRCRGSCPNEAGRQLRTI